MKVLKSALLLTFSIFIAFSASAQMPAPTGGSQSADVSDEELKQFANLVPEIQEVQMKYNKKMRSTIQESGIGIQKFNQMAQTKANPEKELQGTEQEVQQFNEAYSEVQNIQAKQNEELQGIIVESPLSNQRFQEISMAIRQDQELQQKVRGMMQPEGGQQGGSQ